MPPRPHIAALLAALLAASGLAHTAAANFPNEAARAALAETLSQLLRDAIPLRYDKQKDWGATREITAGYRVEGKPFHLHVHRRKHAVNHGVWKHYKLQFVDPDQTLRLRLSDLQPLPGGRMAFTLTLDANLDVWSRAKVYQYGVHLIALEVEGDMKLHLEIHGEVGLQATVAGGAAAIAVQPLIHDAKWPCLLTPLKQGHSLLSELIEDSASQAGFGSLIFERSVF